MHRQAAPENFSAELERALEYARSHGELEALVALAQCELSYVQVIQFDRALKQIDTELFDESCHCRFAILSSSTIDHLLPALSVASFRYGVRLDLFAPNYGQYRQELLLAESALSQFAPHIVLMSLSVRELLSGISLSAPAEDVDNAIESYVGELIALWLAAQQLSDTTVIQQTFLNIGETIFGSLDRQVPGAPTQIVRRLNQTVIQAAAENNVLIYDLDRPVEENGLAFWFDNARWLQAKMEIAPAAAMAYADRFTQILAALRGQSRKCLVLDLDNTLWGGVIGDDGVENISLGQGSGIGEAFLAFQRYLRQLRDRGIILAVCSKNEQSIAKAAFADHPEMLLKISDFAAFVANWDDKATNLLRIAEQLNIGLDSLVFVDDNPAERALIRQSLPMVAVPELPSDPSDYVRAIANTGYFETVSFTIEDQKRNALYAVNRERTVLQRSSHTIDDYLESLKMQMLAETFTDADLPRISQLINKTNQFNMTTRRKTPDEVHAAGDDQENLTLQVRLGDRFGDNGLISAVILEPLRGQNGVYEIETWVMSCRVFGRQLEYEVLNAVVAAAQQVNAKQIIGRFIPTARNILIADLYAKLGFERSPESESDESGETRWKLDVKCYKPHRTHILTRPPKNG